ncbi:hypothetical protein ABE096_01795 [Robertmurraya massiliosenegalensis]|uniref:hypothetical protein n=1 Tax=Robertmurraya TaxID=2837507 RepID=UPI0039A41406
MDKSGNPKTITIKINGKDRTIQKKKQGDLSEDRNERENSTSSTYHKLEKITSEELSAAEQAKEEEEFDWILPEMEEEEQLQEYKIVSKSKGKKGLKKPKQKKSFTNKGMFPSVLLIVFLAVVSGTTLGILMLKMVISDSAIEAVGGPLEEALPEEGAATPGTASIELPAITGYMVQGGVFTTEEAANVEATAMADKGVPTEIIGMDDKFFIFVGVADSLENAKALGTELQGNGVETFSKEVELGGASLSALQDSEQKLLEAAPTLYTLLSEMYTTAHLSNAVSAEQKTALASQLEAWQAIGSIENEQLQQLKSELDGAVMILNSDGAALVEAQQHLLNFLAIYQSL